MTGLKYQVPVIWETWYFFLCSAESIGFVRYNGLYAICKSVVMI